ncbi:unnamed protein product [Boreogadus saida]
MGDTQSAPRDAEQDAERDTDSGRAQDSGDCNVEDKLPQNDTQISGLHGKSDGPLAELNDHLEDEFIDDLCDTESPLVSARENVSDTFATVDDKEALLEDVEINDVTDSDPEADEASLNDQEDKMNEINKGFRGFFSNISLRLTLKQGPEDKPAEIAADVLPNQEVAPCIPGDTCDGANESPSETCEDNGDPHTAQDSADNESTTCPTVTDMTSEENVQEDVEHITPAATEEVDQEATEGILAQADTEGVRSEVEPGGSCPRDSAEEEVLSPIKVFFTTGIFSSLRKKKKPAEEESLKNKTNQKESLDMDREEPGGIEGIGKDLAQDELFPNAERAVVEEKQKTKNGNEEVMRESAPTNNDHGTGENLVNANDELLSSEEKVKFPSSSLQRLLSGANLKKVSTKQQGRKKSSDSVERVTCPLQSSVESTESTTDKSPEVAPEEVNKLEESAWETLKRLLTPKKFQKNSTLSNEEVIVSSKPEEPKLSEGEEIEDGNTEESRKRKDSIVSWDSLLCGSGNRRSRKSSSADEQKARTEGDDNRAATESRHATDLDSSHEMEDNLASSPEHGRSPSDDEGSTWKSLKRLVTPKRKSRDGEETKEHTSDSEIIQDESSFSLKKFLPGRRKRRPYEKQEEVPSDKPEREEHSDEEDSDTPAIIPLSEFDIPVTESQGKIQAVLESQTAEAEAPKEQEELSGQTTEAVVMCDSTPALPKGTKDTETALEKLTSTTSASMEEVDDLSEIVSKLQLLSDIPEEGLIEESIATAASFADDAARDDTIADVIEFTSEAVTAPEPIDITVEDETEMVSAVSQLTDSSKTSGNTTPVPADYDVKETDNLLHQVVESISATQNDALECTRDQNPERIVEATPTDEIAKGSHILSGEQMQDVAELSVGYEEQQELLVVEVLGNKDLSGDILVPEGPLVSMTAEVENETGVLTEEALVVEQLPTMDYDPNEIPQQSVAKEEDELVKVLIESDAPPTLDTAPLISESSVVLIIVEQVTFDDLGSNAENAQPVSTVEEDKETVTQPERCLLEKELVTVESDFIEEPQHISVTDVVQIADITKELEPSTSIDVVSVDYDAGIVEVLEHRGVSKNLESNPVNASTLIQVEDEKETVTQSAQSLLEKELVIVESDRSEETQHISVKDDVQVAEVTKELDPQTHINLATAGIVEVLQNQVQSGEIPGHEGSSLSVTAEVENETGVLTEEALVVEQLPTMDYDPNAIPQQSVAKENDEAVQVSTEFEAPPTLHAAPLISESSIVEIFVEQVTFEDLGSNAENAQPVSSVEEDKETVTQPEQCLLEKELVVVESDLIEEPQHISFKDVLQIADITMELEASTSIDVVSVDYDAGIVEVLEHRGVSKNLESNAVNASTLIQVEDEKETVTQTAQSLLEKELVIVESDHSEETQHISVKDDVQVAEVTKELDPQTHINLASAGIVEVLENQVLSGEIPGHEGSSLSVSAEVENETGVLTDEALVVKQLPTMDYDPNEIPQQSVAKENYEAVQVSTEIEAPPTLHAAPLISESSIVEIFVEQVTFEDLGSNAENAQPVSTVEEDKETVTQPEQCLLEKELVVVESDLIEEPQHISFKDVLQIADITMELEASTSIDVVSVDYDAGIVEVLEHRGVSKNLESNAVNASTLIQVEDEKETVTQTAQSLLEKEHVIVESDRSEETQQISVKDDVQIAEVTKELDPQTHINLASDDIVEVLENQVLSGEIPGHEGSSLSVSAEVENETGVLTDEALVVKQLPTMDYDPNEIPQQSVVKENEEVVQVSTEIEAPPTLHAAPLISESSIVEIFEEQVTFEDLGSNAENAQPVSTVEEDKETVTQPERCLLEKELVVVESDVIVEPQHISFTDVLQIADITKEFEASTTIDEDSVDFNAGIVEVLEKQDISEDILVHDVASVTAEIENETEILQQALVVKTVSNLDYDPNEIPQQNVLKDGEVVKLSEFEAPSHVQITPLTSDSSIVEVIEKQVTEELGSDAEKANTLFTVENAKVIYSEQSLLVKEPVSIESNLNEEPQHISVTDVQVTEVTKELEASTFDQVALLDSNADIVEIFEKQVVSQNIPVPNGASVSVTAVVENKTEVLLQVAGGNALPTGNDDPHEIPQQRVVEQDCKVVQTEFEAPPTVQIAPLVLGASMVEVIGKQVLSDIPVTKGEKASASTTAEAGEEAAVLIAQELIKKVLRTVVGDPDEIPRQCAVKNEHEFADIAKLLDGSTEVDIDSINSDTSVPQALQEHVLSEVITTPDTDNASVNSVTEVTEMLEAPTAVKLVLINRETILPKVFEKQQVQDYVALVVPEPRHEVVSNAVNDEGDINKLTGVEEKAEMVEDVAAMQDEDGAAMQACSVQTSMDHDANRETPNIREPLLDVMATEEEPQDTVEHVRVLEPCVEEGMIETAKKSKGDVEVKSAEEMGVTDAKEGMDIGCIVQNEVQNVYTSLATEEEMLDKMDNVTAKEVDQQKNQAEVSDEGAKEESCLKEEPGSAVQVIVTPPTDEQKGREIIQSEPSELEAQKLTKKESDASIERTAPEVLSETEIGNEEETASNIVFATTDDVSIYKLKPDLDQTKVELKKESDKNVIEEDSSCSPELLAANETIEAKQAIVVPQIITSSEKVQPTSEMGVEEIQATENVESNIQMEVTELEKEKEDPTVKIEVTELQGLEKIEPNIQKEVKELGTEQKRQIQASEVNVNVAPKIQMEGTEFPATEKLESTLQMEGTELQVTEEAEQNIKIGLTNIKVTVKVFVQAIEAIDLEKTKVDAHLIDDSSFSPQEVAAKEIMDAKQEQTHPCEMVTPSQEGEPTIKNEEATEIQITEKVKPKIQMEATELQGKKKVEPNIQIAFTEMKDPLTQRERPEVGVQAEEAIEKARTIQMAEVPERLQEACVSEVSVTRVIEVTGLVQELDSTREMIQAEPVALQVGLEQDVFLSQTGPADFAEEPLETTQQRLVHVEPAERTVPSSPPVQPEVVVESAEPVSQWEGELEQDVWLDAEEDIGKQEGGTAWKLKAVDKGEEQGKENRRNGKRTFSI